MAGPRTSTRAPMAERDVLILIPARMASTRLPGKPLADIAGLPMIVHVLRRAQAANVGAVAVATDSQAIAAAVEQAGGRAVMTRADHLSGLGPHLRGTGEGRPAGKRRCHRQCPGRPAHPRAGRSCRRARSADRFVGRHQHDRRRDQDRRRTRQPQRGKGRRHAGHGKALARALFHPRHGASRAKARSTTISASMRIAAPR